MPQPQPESERLDDFIAPEALLRQVAHDLLNPLTAVVGYSEMLTGPSPNPQIVAVLQSEAMRALEVSQRILALTAKGQPLTVAEQIHFLCLSVRHEINNPLTAILGLSEMALASRDLPPEVELRFQKILAMAEEIREVLRRLENY